MYQFIFYEKPACSGNSRQKEILKSYGIEIIVKDLLATKWTFESLASYFEGLKTTEIFNIFAPQIKNGLIDITTISKDDAIKLMIENPILIKRPLIDINGTKICGFNIEKINKKLDINISFDKKVDTCLSSNKCTNV